MTPKKSLIDQSHAKQMDEFEDFLPNLVQVVRLALSERQDDLRLYVARIVRKLRVSQPEIASQLEAILKTRPPHPAATPFRRGAVVAPQEATSSAPVDEESRLSLFKTYKPDAAIEPFLSKRVRFGLDQLIRERKQTNHLMELGLLPTRSAMFMGHPGVGKTLTARWIAKQLSVPLLVLDLTAVMSSLLGRSGVNLRAALDYAKSIPCVLLLDEIDAIAKRRSDDSDIGELKRLVTVILQEVDDWPSTGLLLAATNHPELIDPALWRRFELIIEFDAPSDQDIGIAIERFLATDSTHLKKWVAAMALLHRGSSYSDIERDMNRLRRTLAIGSRSEEEMIHLMVDEKIGKLSHQERIDLAVSLVSPGGLSQHTSSSLTGVSRDTIRKKVAQN